MGMVHVRRFFTADDARARGLTRDTLRWGERTGRWRRVGRGVYAEGPDDPSPLEEAAAGVVAAGGVACGSLAGVLHRLDAVELRGPEVSLPPARSGRRPGVR